LRNGLREQEAGTWFEDDSSECAQGKLNRPTEHAKQTERSDNSVDRRAAQTPASVPGVPPELEPERTLRYSSKALEFAALDFLDCKLAHFRATPVVVVQYMRHMSDFVSVKRAVPMRG
jgi:hypothetical protein